MEFRVELVQGALLQLDFLHMVSQQPALQTPAVLKRAFLRYERLWLPLAAKHAGSKPLVAPLDIEWVWHCHLLAPLAYEKDCKNVVDTIVDHQLVSGKERETLLKHTLSVWKQEYPLEPFELGLSGTGSVEGASGDAGFAGGDHSASEPSKISYDVVSAASRQKVFFYQVSLPHYRDTRFLTYSLGRYRKFLYLKQQNPDLFIVPCYDTDLLWHTHMLHPLNYKADMEAILGKTFPHDDSVNDRSNGSRLNSSQTQTQELWKRHFGENFSLYGSMYRGDPPNGKLHDVTDEQYALMATKICRLRLENLHLRILPHTKGKLTLKFLTSANKKARSSFANLQVESLGHSVAQISNFDTRDANGVKFQLVENVGFACFGSREVMAENDVEVLTMIDSASAGDGRSLTNLSKSVPLGQVGIRCALPQFKI